MTYKEKKNLVEIRGRVPLTSTLAPVGRRHGIGLAPLAWHSIKKAAGEISEFIIIKPQKKLI